MRRVRGGVWLVVILACGMALNAGAQQPSGAEAQTAPLRTPSTGPDSKARTSPNRATPPPQAPQNQASQEQSPGQASQGQPAQQNPTQEEKKNDAGNPAQAVADMARQMGTAALIKARDWENGWLTGVYVEKGHVMVPMTADQRRRIYWEQTLATPSPYLKRMFAAGIDQARGQPRQWDDGFAGFAERYASRDGQFIAANSLAALGNAGLKYEVRYDQCRCDGLWPRIGHAIVRNFLTYNESEQELRPQWGLYGGSFGGGMISTAWKPKPRNPFAEGGRAMAGQAAYGVLLNLFIEFSTEINRAINPKRGARKK